MLEKTLTEEQIQEFEEALTSFSKSSLRTNSANYAGMELAISVSGSMVVFVTNAEKETPGVKKHFISTRTKIIKEACETLPADHVDRVTLALVQFAINGLQGKDLEEGTDKILI